MKFSIPSSPLRKELPQSYLIVLWAKTWMFDVASMLLHHCLTLFEAYIYTKSDHIFHSLGNSPWHNIWGLYFHKSDILHCIGANSCYRNQWWGSLCKSLTSLLFSTLSSLFCLVNNADISSASCCCAVVTFLGQIVHVPKK